MSRLPRVVRRHETSLRVALQRHVHGLERDLELSSEVIVDLLEAAHLPLYETRHVFDDDGPPGRWEVEAERSVTGIARTYRAGPNDVRRTGEGTWMIWLGWAQVEVRRRPVLERLAGAQPATHAVSDDSDRNDGPLLPLTGFDVGLESPGTSQGMRDMAPATLLVEEAAELLGISRAEAQCAVERRLNGDATAFPTHVLRIGDELRVPTRPLYEALGIRDDQQNNHQSSI